MKINAPRCAFATFLIACCAMLLSQKQLTAAGERSDEPAPQSLFAALEDGSVQARVIPLGPERISVILENKRAHPIVLELPGKFGATHVLAQRRGGFDLGLGNGAANGLPGGGFGGGGVGNAALAGGAGQGGGQGLGGAFLGNGGGAAIGVGNPGFAQPGAGLRGGRGLFRLEPFQKKRLDAITVCLEHGKPDPAPRMKYRLVRLEQLTNQPVIHALCAALHKGEDIQPVVQAAAWHIANGLSWSDLADLNRRESRYAGNERYFTPEALYLAKRLIDDVSTKPVSLQPYLPVSTRSGSPGDALR